MPDKEMDQALDLLTYGVYVITCAPGGTPEATLTPWLSQVSLQPPALAFAVPKAAPIHDLLAGGAPFVVNILRAGQKTLAEQLLSGSGDGDGLGGLESAEADNGAPYLVEALATLQCEAGGSMDTGKDFTLFVGKMTAARILSSGQPLTLRQAGINPFK